MAAVCSGLPVGFMFGYSAVYLCPWPHKNESLSLAVVV